MLRFFAPPFKAGTGASSSSGSSTAHQNSMRQAFVIVTYPTVVFPFVTFFVLFVFSVSFPVFL
ncbi:hypothetical protein WG66_016072 [Moniliophthora roreri]|nr:hypothetical protein WG66_016072 [Moniliophthora roreri]